MNKNKISAAKKKHNLLDTLYYAIRRIEKCDVEEYSFSIKPEIYFTQNRDKIDREITGRETIKFEIDIIKKA